MLIAVQATIDTRMNDVIAGSSSCRWCGDTIVKGKRGWRRPLIDPRPMKELRMCPMRAGGHQPR